MKNGVIGAEHEFHDKEFAVDWAERFTPTPERLDLFNIILSELQSRIPEDGNVVELGIGPGYLVPDRKPAFSTSLGIRFQ